MSNCPYCNDTGATHDPGDGWQPCICQDRDVLPLNKPIRVHTCGDTPCMVPECRAPSSDMRCDKCHLRLPDRHQRVRVYLKSQPDHPLEGVYRARICSVDNGYFDHNGTAIWLTTIFDHFIAINDIDRWEPAE